MHISTYLKNLYLAVTWAEPIVNTIPKMLRKMAIPRDNAWLTIQWGFFRAKTVTVSKSCVIMFSLQKNGQKKLSKCHVQTQNILFSRKKNCFITFRVSNFSSEKKRNVNVLMVKGIYSKFWNFRIQDKGIYLHHIIDNKILWLSLWILLKFILQLHW